MPDKIDKVAESIAVASEQIRQKLIQFFLDEYSQVNDINAAVQKIASTNITELILKDFGLGKELNRAMALYPGIVNDVRKQIGRVDGTMASNLKLVDESYLANHVRDVGGDLTRVLTQSVVSDLSTAQMKQILLDSTTRLRDYQINALVNTTVRDYSSAVFADNAKKFLPDTAKYLYVGPNDGKTREACKCYLGWQEPGGMTMEEINGNPCGVDFVHRGGWNCRHEFSLVFDSVKDKI